VSTAALLEEMRRRGVRFEVDGLTLRVDALKEAATDELRHTLREHKCALIRHLERERLRLEAAHRRGLVITWAREPGHVALHDPTTGEWHEVLASECLSWILEDAKAYGRRGGSRGRAGGSA
jgi:TubC N-terminal docking domain